MPRRLSLSANEQANLLTLPKCEEDLIRYYSFNESDLSLIRQRRGDANRLGFAIQLCLLRYPGYALASDTVVTESFIAWIASSIQVETKEWKNYGARVQTRQEHLQELRAYLTPGRDTCNFPHIGLKVLNEKIDDSLKPYLEAGLKAV
jgi:TnpA family transposase